VEPSTQDRLRLRVIIHAHQCLQDLQKLDMVPQPEAVLCSGGGWTVLLVTYPTPAGADPSGLSDCDRDCLCLLAQVSRPLSAARVRNELEKRGRIWGIATVKRSLAGMKRLKLVCNSRRRPRGYWIEDCMLIARTLADR
jgi:hypothetical protein